MMNHVNILYLSDKIDYILKYRPSWMKCLPASPASMLKEGPRFFFFSESIQAFLLTTVNTGGLCEGLGSRELFRQSVRITRACLIVSFHKGV